VTIFIGAVALAEFLLLPLGFVAVIVGAAGFALAGLAMAITLYITRRQSRSA
jgi:hypothetical protein